MMYNGRIFRINLIHLVLRFLLYVIIICGSIIMMFPFVWMVSTSLKQGGSVFQYPPKLIPNPVAWKNYQDVFIKTKMLLAFFNSVKIALINTTGTLLSASLAAYSFAKIRFRFKNQLFLLLLSTMMIPGQVTLIPMFIWFKNLGWLNTHYPLIVPAVLCNAYGVFLLRQFFMTIPDSYSESAKIDGASQPNIFFRIMLPLCVPALATLGVFTFMSNWNNFLSPMIFLSTNTKFTIPLMIKSFQGAYFTSWNLLLAAATISVIPIIIVYMFAQRYFIEGVVLSGIKG